MPRLIAPSETPTAGTIRPRPASTRTPSSPASSPSTWNAPGLPISQPRKGKTLRPDDLLEERHGYNEVSFELKRDLVRDALKKPVEGRDDLELLLALTQLLRRDLQLRGTGIWHQVWVSDITDQRLLFRAVQRVSRRTKIQGHQFEYRDYAEFNDYLVERYRAEADETTIRRYLGSIFNPIEDQVHRIQDVIWDTELILPISPRGATGWSKVDSEIEEMRQQFRSARTQQANSSIGNSCNRILQFLSEAAFNPERHLPAGEDLPPIAKTKTRFGMIINRELAGPDQASLRKVAHATVELAEAVKHGTSPSRTDAGIAADSVIMLVNLIRRITEDGRTQG